MSEDNFELKELLNYIRDDIKVVKTKLDEISSKMITKEECTNNQKVCLNTVEEKKKELEINKSEVDIKKYVAIGGIITGVITASATAITGIVKLFL